MKRQIAILSLTVCLFPYWAVGQTNGSIAGTVTDSSGAVVPDAKIVVTQLETGLSRTTHTNRDGTYTVPFLYPRLYNISVEHAGFQRFTQAGIRLQADEALTLNFTMSIGNVTQTVEVSANANMINTETPTLGEVVNEQRMVDLPLNGRNAMQLTTLVAGVASFPSGGQAVNQAGFNFPTTTPISTNGARPNQVMYNLDGANQTDAFTNVNMGFPMPDALQEFSLQTSNYNAQYGFNGGGVVNAIVKSGTNTLHGDVFEFVRNRVFNARNTFAATRDDVQRNQFGFTIGGPVVVPGYDGRNHTFFFVGYQGTRFNTSSLFPTAIVPTAAMRTGDFSALLNAASPGNPLGAVVDIENPTTGQMYSGNIIPQNQLNPVSQNILSKYVPLPTLPSGIFDYTVPSTSRYDEVTARVDHSIGTSDVLTAHYFLDDYESPAVFEAGNLMSATNGTTIHQQSAMIKETHSFGATLTNDFHFSVNRTFPAVVNPNPFTMADVGVKGLNLYNPPFDKADRIYVPGYFRDTVSSNSFWTTNDFNWADDVTKAQGHHTIAFGADFERVRNDIYSANNSGGNFDFRNMGSGFPLVEYMLGVVYQFEQQTLTELHTRQNIAGFYAQDTYRASKRLTLTLGLRYEPAFPFTTDHVAVFSPQAYYAGTKSSVFVNAPPGLVFPGDPGVPKNGTIGDYNNFAPRLGFAFDPTGSGKTSIRGGAGYFYDLRNGTQDIGGFRLMPPWTADYDYVPGPGPFDNPWGAMTSPIPAPPPSKNVTFPSPVGNAYSFPLGQKWITGLTYQWNLTVEHTLSPDLLVRGAYVGSHGSHLNDSVNLNAGQYIPGNSVFDAMPLAARRPYQGYTNISMDTQGDNSNFSALELSLEKRVAPGSAVLNGLTVLANYTWSKSLDNNVGEAIEQIAGFYEVAPYSSPLNRILSYGPSDWDMAQEFVVSYVWDLPAMKSAPLWRRSLIGGWQLNGIFSANTGTPLTVLAGVDQSHTGLNNDRGYYLGGSPYSTSTCGTLPNCVSWLNKGAFALPATGTFGNVGRGALRGPGFWNWDMGFIKHFSVGERCRVELRWELFNAFNHANPLAPDQVFSDATFGKILSASSPRIMQFGLKVMF